MKVKEGDSLWLRIAPILCFGILILPVGAGLLGAFLPAFGYFPVLGSDSFSLAPWQTLWSTPGLLRSTLLALWIGFSATLISLFTVVALFAKFHDSRLMWVVRRILSPLLSVPHAAIAIGLAFVIAPSGLLFRLMAQAAQGFEQPPDLLIVHDSLGLSLLLALVLKEVPFLFLMGLAALPQIDPHRQLAAARSMGYAPSIAWLKVVLPRLYAQIRMPVIAVLAYSISVVDAALILGPTTPPTLAVATFKWMSDPDLAKRFTASAGAVLMFAITVASIGAWMGGERLVRRIGREWIEQGEREQGAKGLSIGAYTFGTLILVLVMASAAAVLLWAFAESWPYPNVVPDRLSGRTWSENAPALARPLVNALIVGLAATGLAAFVTVSLLEGEVRRGEYASSRWMNQLLYVPLIVPQIAFLPGLHILLIALDLDSSFVSVIAAHLVFVLPYVYLSLSQPWSHFDDRYRQAALSMGASPLRVLLRIRLPMLLAALLTAMAVGFAVSVGQYLPTLLLGAGRVPTITTEAVALASGGDRRLTALLALLQSLLPLVGFLVVLFVPLALFHNRRGMRTA